MRFVGEWPIVYRYRRPPSCEQHQFIYATDGGRDVCYRCGDREKAQ